MNGTIRLTGLSGSVQIDDMSIGARLPVAGDPSSYELYHVGVPVPEPGVLSLGILGSGLLGLRMCRRKALAA